MSDKKPLRETRIMKDGSIRQMRCHRACFRMNSNELDHMEQMKWATGGNRSELIRISIRNGGVVYVGRELIKTLSEYRADVARVGNLVRMACDYISAVLELPELTETDRAELRSVINKMGDCYEELYRTRLKTVEMLESANEAMRRLNKQDQPTKKDTPATTERSIGSSNGDLESDLPS